jgi:ribosome-associated protein
MSKKPSPSNVLEDIPIINATASESQLASTLVLAKAAARAAAENKAQDLILLDISRQTSIFDYFLIGTGTSRRQIHAISDEIDHALEALGETRMSTSGYDESRWIVLDYGGLIVHLFDEETRAFYDLEGLWADSPPVDLTDALRNTGAAVLRTES